MNELKEDRPTQLATKIIKQLKRREGNYFLRTGRLLREIIHHFGAFSLTISALYHYRSRHKLKLFRNLNSLVFFPLSTEISLHQISNSLAVVAKIMDVFIHIQKFVRFLDI